jgi:SpoVK/Ycf46/Vps4 family AAA+-type ATPase
MGFLDKHRAVWHEAGRAVAPALPPAAEQPAVTQPVQAGRPFCLETAEPRWRLDELVLAEETREAIGEAAQAILAAPLVEAWLGDGDRAGRRVAVNFYGPPGTGKTSAADALAHLLGMRVMKVSYAELESRFVGDTPKNVRQAFCQAREAGALLFFDEADSILGRRFSDLSQPNEAYINQTRSTMMLELDAFEGAVAFATNLAGNYDEAFVRRIASHVRFMLPGRDLRLLLWRKYLPDMLPCAADVTPATLADWSGGFSPADVATAVRRAAVQAAVRPEPQRRVTLDDLRRAIDRVRLAKEEVGRRPAPGGKTTVSYEVVSEEGSDQSAAEAGARSPLS